jgi:hypothetical protein
MAPPLGRLGSAMKLPVQVWMLPAEIAVVGAFAAELSQQSYGAAFSRAEALRMVVGGMCYFQQSIRALSLQRGPTRAGARSSQLYACVQLGIVVHFFLSLT